MRTLLCGYTWYLMINLREAYIRVDVFNSQIAIRQTFVLRFLFGFRVISDSNNATRLPVIIARSIWRRYDDCLSFLFGEKSNACPPKCTWHISWPVIYKTHILACTCQTKDNLQYPTRINCLWKCIEK